MNTQNVPNIVIKEKNKKQKKYWQFTQEWVLRQLFAPSASVFKASKERNLALLK